MQLQPRIRNTNGELRFVDLHIGVVAHAYGVSSNVFAQSVAAPALLGHAGIAVRPNRSLTIIKLLARRHPLALRDRFL